MDTLECGCPDKGLAVPMTSESENRFWKKVKDKVFTDTKKDLLEKKSRLSVYYCLIGKCNHAALAFSEDNRWAFTLELKINRDKEVYPKTDAFNNIPKGFHRLKGIYVNTTPKNLYEKGVEVMKMFGSYNKGCNNCQDFIFQFLTNVGIKSPILPFSEKGKTAAKIVTAPLWVLGSGLLSHVGGVVGTVTAPIWYPICRMKGTSAELANAFLCGFAIHAVAGVVAGPVAAGMVMFNDDELKEYAQKAKEDGIEVEKEHAD